MTLNLWCYFDWDARKDNIVRLIQSESPDIIALQEVQVNTAFSATPQSQYIAQHAGYQHHLFVPTWFITDNMPWDENIKTRQ